MHFYEQRGEYGLSKRVLAFDFGASSGRAILGTFADGKIHMEEIHRFSNDPVNIRGVFHWDVLRLFHEIKQGITKAVHAGGFDAIGIDTWGVDFGLIDKKGHLINNPVHYRDTRTIGMMDKVFETIPKEELYHRTGIQFAALNTIFQLAYLQMNEPEVLAQADKLLLMPDLFAYLLTGVARAEYCNVSTTQCLDPVTGDWAYDLLDRLQIPRRLFSPMIDAGETYGLLSDEICEELGAPKVPVIAVSTHDTGSAVVAVPSSEKDFIFISCGTWSLFGTELAQPIINDASFGFNLTNEGGYGRTTRFLKNIMGLWLIQESRRQWIREGFDVSYADLEKEALAAKPFQCFINPDDDDFVSPGNLPKRVQEYCRRTGQYVPQNRGEIMRCIYESLAMKYRYTFRAIREVTGLEYNTIHMIGGGTKDRLLCQMAADACNTNVIAGPIEATATGNIAVQLIALGEIADLADARRVIAASEEPKFYEPQQAAAYDEAYVRFEKLQ
ncbi:MAG: rhamnulokinase [Clostridia bacterium]|nr:rhamnulokinase [Clostridia bacterium]